MTYMSSIASHKSTEPESPDGQIMFSPENRCAVSDPVPIDLTGDDVVPLSHDDTLLRISDVGLLQEDMER